jgi:hypothetical protein
MSTHRSDVARPPGTTHGSQAIRNRRAYRRALRWSSGTTLGATAIAAAFWFADREDPQIDSLGWAMMLIILALIPAAMLFTTGEVLADAVAWNAALADLVEQRGQPREEPADAILTLSWSPARDVAQVSWNGVPAGTWWPTGGPFWQPLPATGPVEPVDVLHTSRRGYADLRVEGRPYLVNRDGSVLVDADGTEWSLQGLSWATGPRETGVLPRVLGPGGAIAVLQSHRRLVIAARSRSC